MPPPHRLNTLLVAPVEALLLENTLKSLSHDELEHLGCPKLPQSLAFCVWTAEAALKG